MARLLMLMVSVLALGCVSQTPRENSNSGFPSVRKAATAEVKLSDYSPYNYEVLFTNPLCRDYKYKTEVRSRGGEVLKQKPKNVFCDPKYDEITSGNQPNSPQKRLVEWINDPATTEVWFTYLSFSNKAVKDALCSNARSRGLKVNFVLDSGTGLGTAQELVACSPENIAMKTRGNVKGLGLAHNKIFLFNPNSQSEIRIVFSSGNMTAGPVLHHENWHFITTSPQSYFAQVHKCVMSAGQNDTVMSSRRTYMAAVRNCRQSINAPEESDIKTFFVPGEGETGFANGSGRRTAFEFLIDGDGINPGLNQSSQVWLACHRFLHADIIAKLKERTQAGMSLRITADDDTFYDANDRTYNQQGGTQRREWLNIDQLMKVGAEAKFMETNPSARQLHHSKFVIFDNKAVLAGAMNFTKAAFRQNLENIYYITVPEVVQEFRRHYERQWTTQATAIPDLPTVGNLKDSLDLDPSGNTEAERD